MSPIRDTNLVVRSSTEGDAVNSGSGTTATLSYNLEVMYGTPLNGMALQVIVPAFTNGTSIFVEALASTSTNPTTDDFVLQSAKIAAAGEYIFPFTIKPAAEVKYLEVNFGLTGSDSDMNFGAMEAYVVQNVGYTWSR